MLFVSDRDGVRDIYRQRLSADGQPMGAPDRVTTAANVHTFTLSRDGSRLTWGTLIKNNEIWMAPVSAVTTPFGAAQQVTHEKVARESVALSKDGRWLAYESDRGGRFRHIYKVAFDGRAAVGDPIRITSDSADDFAPRWSHDDRQLVFHRNVGGIRDIFVIDADGRRLERVTNDAWQDYDPDWSPDGQQVVYRARLDSLGTTQAVFVVRRGADGRWGTPQPVTVDGRAGLGQSLRWSPRGDLLAGGAGLVPVEGGEIRSFVDRKRLDGTVRFVTFGREPHALYFVTLDSTNVSSYWRTHLPVGRAAPNPPQLLLRLSDDTRRAGTNRFDTDGKRLFFLIAADEADIVVGTLTRE